MKKVFFIIIITVLLSTHTHGQQPAFLPFSSSSLSILDNVAASNKDNISVLTQRYIDAYYDKLELDEKRYLETEKVKLNAKVIDARKLSAAAVVISATASSEFLPIVMSAIAALSDPEDALLVNNFGAMVRTLYGEDSVKINGWNDDAINALLYAKTLQPDSPLILTNLGNSYIDKKMFAEAEQCYKEALKYDRDFGTAHEGMARIYNHKKDGKRAIDELIKAGKFGFSASMRKGYLEAKKNGGFVDSSFWEDSQSDDQNDDDNKREDDKLVLPDFPKWGSRDAFFYSSPNLIIFAQTVIEKGMMGGLNFAAKYHADELMESFENMEFDSQSNEEESGEDADEEMEETDSQWDADDDNSDLGDLESVEIMPSYGQQLFMLELVNDYYVHKIEVEYNKNIGKRKEIDETLKKVLLELKEDPRFQKVMDKILVSDYNGAKIVGKGLHDEVCRKADAHFNAWRDMTLGTYGEIKSLLYEYWKTAYQVTGDIYDEDVINYFNDIRELTVYASLVPIALDFTLLPTSYIVVDQIVPTIAPGEDVRTKKPEPVSDIEMSEKDKKECAIKGKKISFGIGPVGFGVTCDTWELEVLEGVGGSYKRNFKTGESEVTVLVGVSKKVGAVELGAKQGVTFKFNKQGNFTGWSYKSDAGAKMGIGPITVSQNLEYSSDIGMITSPRASITVGGVGYGRN
ncbi:MAG: tetratricopeptide repeat protein [Dysgonamonadaceae bacterium]|nr:tetratricopeptide repeat protein [Patescibacteria group bacterium]MDD4605837.1 tetratricopeptide repeat protein [Dysgonamonadaceae bacterium]HTN68795.1 tetratricopeptide repeat protein [Dysgonamonadaceae bacterium]